jgi:hypothetical protein
MTALLVAAAVVAAGPMGQASAAGPQMQRVYFQCGQSKVSNTTGQPTSWAAAPPAESISAGSGCGFADVMGVSSTTGGLDLGAARFAGSFNGNLGSLNVRLDTVSVGAAQAGQQAQLDVTLKVDGRDPFGGPRRIAVQPILAISGRFHSYFFSIMGLPYMSTIEDRSHSVELTAEIVDQPAVDWVYGAREVPSGIDFNPVGYHNVVITPSGSPQPTPAPTASPSPSPSPSPSASPTPSPSPTASPKATATPKP